jgi:DNA repair exonuclease SbcCD ATPase subunit
MDFVEEIELQEPEQQQDPIPKKKVLYDAVSKKYDLGTYDEFDKKLKDPNKRKALYDYIGKEFELGTYQDFESKISDVPKKKDLAASGSIGAEVGGKAGASKAQSGEPIDPLANQKKIFTGLNKAPTDDFTKLESTSKGSKKQVEQIGGGIPFEEIAAQQNADLSKGDVPDNTVTPLPPTQMEINDRLAREKTHQKNIKIAIDNTTKEYFRLKGIKAREGSALYEEQKQKVQKAFIDGDVAYHMDLKTNTPRLDRITGLFENLKKGWDESNAANDEAAFFVHDMTTEERVKYIQEKQLDESKKEPSEYLDERQGGLGWAGHTVGGAAPFLAKAAAGAAVGAGAVALAPASLGSSLAGLPVALSFLFTAPDAANQGGMNETIRRYNMLKKQNPAMSDIDAMAQAESGVLAGGIGGIVENALFMGTMKLPLENASKKVIGDFGTSMIKSGVNMGGATAAVDVAQKLEGNLEGYKTSGKEIAESAVNTFVENATVGMALHGIIQGVPKLFNSALKFSLRNVPKQEISETLNMNVEAGTITHEQAKKVAEDIDGYNAALDKINPKGLSENSQASIAGLIQAKDNIKKEAETVDESLRKPYDEKIEAINQQVADIQRTNKPFEHEVDDVTGNNLAKPTFDDVAKQRVNDVADKISKGKEISDVIDIQTQAKFPEQLTKQLEKILREEKSANKEKENPNTEISDNIEKYLEDNKATEIKGEPEKITEPVELTVEPKKEEIIETKIAETSPEIVEPVTTEKESIAEPVVSEVIPETKPEPKSETKELDKLANNVPDSGKITEYMSKDTIEKYTGETPINDQSRGIQELEIALNHGEKIIEKAQELYGKDYAEKTLDYIDKSTAGVSNKALMYVSLENALGREKVLNPDKAAEITKQQALVYAKSQAFARENSLALNYQKLRKIAQVGYDINKVTDNFFSAEELVAKKDIEKAIEADAETVQKEYESQSAEASTPEIDKAIKEGVEKEIAKLYEALPKEKKTAADKAIAALDKIHEKLRGKAYESTLGVPIAIIDAGVVTIRAALKAGVQAAKAIEMGIEKIKEKYGKEWANEKQFRKDYLDGLKEQGVLDAQQRRQAEKEYRMLETERNRQLARVADLTEKLKTLQGGDRPATNPKEAKPDVPEIESLKQKVKEETQKLNALDAQQKRIDTLETELERLQNRLPKEKNDTVKKQISDREQELKDKIEEEKDIIRKENKENNSLRLSNAKDAVRQRIEKIKTEIANKERELKEKNKPLNEDLELTRLREVEKSITELRDKYLPEEKDPHLTEKQRERVKDKLVKDIIGLNEQINAGKRTPKNEKADYSNDAEIAKLTEIKEAKKSILNEIDPLAVPKEKTTAEKVTDAEANLQKRIDAIRDEIISGERDLAKSKDKVQSKKLEQLKEQKKSLEALRDKYLPKGKDPYANEKAAKAVEEKLVKENIDLNRQIQKGEKDKVDNKVTPESENIDKLKAERDGRKEILEAIDPTPKVYVENALIEQGFGKEVKVKGETKQVLDWTKLAGAAGTPSKISENVGKALEKSGFNEIQLERIKDKFIQEYVDLRYSVIEKAQNELASRNKETVTADQKSAAKKLAELYTYGLFEEKAPEFEITLNKALGAKVSESGYNEAKAIAKGLETIYSTSFKGVKLSDVSAKAAIEKLEDQMRILLFKESKSQGNNNLKVANMVRGYFDIQQTMILNNLKQAVENPLSGLQQNLIDKILVNVDGSSTGKLADQRRNLMKAVYADMMVNGGIGYGKIENTFVNRRHMDDYVNKLSDNKLYRGIASVVTGKATLNTMDAMWKASITEKKFTSNLIKILTHETNPNRMGKEDALKFVSEKLTGQTFKEAQTAATDIIAKINKDAGSELISPNENQVNRFANDIVKASLEMGGKITPEQITAAYNAAYKSAGLGLGHTPNNFLSTMITDFSAKTEGAINQAIKNKEWNRAAMLTYKSVLFRNVLNPFVGGGANWLVLKFEKTGLGLFTGLGYHIGSKGKIDVGTELGMKRLEERLYNQARIKDNYMRGLVGGITSLLTYATFTTIANEDEYRKWRGSNRWAARYLDTITPEYLLAEMAIKDKKAKQYIATSFNKNDAFDASTKIIKAVDYLSKGDSQKALGAAGEAIGSKFNVPLPWRLVKDGQVIYQGATGQDPYHGNYKPSEGFWSGVLQGGAIEWLGLRPTGNDTSGKKEKKPNKEKKPKKD